MLTDVICFSTNAASFYLFITLSWNIASLATCSSTDLRVLCTIGCIAPIQERPTIISALSTAWPGVPGHREIPELAPPPLSRSLATNLSAWATRRGIHDLLAPRWPLRRLLAVLRVLTATLALKAPRRACPRRVLFALAVRLLVPRGHRHLPRLSSLPLSLRSFRTSWKMWT